MSKLAQTVEKETKKKKKWNFQHCDLSSKKDLLSLTLNTRRFQWLVVKIHVSTSALLDVTENNCLFADVKKK